MNFFRSLPLILFGMAMLSARVWGETAPRAIGLEAQAAVQAMADRVRQGDLEVTVTSIYPRWKHRMAMRNGGMAKLEKKLADSLQQIRTSGVLIQSYQAREPLSVMGVWPGKAVQPDGSEKMVTTEWAAFVPTEAIYRVALPNGGGVKRLRVNGFQVAVRPKAGGEWTFIDGAFLTVQELRAVFPGLPQDIVLPEKGSSDL